MNSEDKTVYSATVYFNKELELQIIYFCKNYPEKQAQIKLNQLTLVTVTVTEQVWNAQKSIPCRLMFYFEYLPKHESFAVGQTNV